MWFGISGQRQYFFNEAGLAFLLLTFFFFLKLTFIIFPRAIKHSTL